MPDRRIVYCYEMYEDENHISVSMATVDLVGRNGRTHLTMTEQGAYLDGLDTPAQRRAGVESQLDGLVRLLEAEELVH